MISVVVPAYSRDQYVAQAVASVESQRTPGDRVEVIVVTNLDLPADRFSGSRAPPRIVRSDDPRFGGMISVAIREASGEVIAFLDDDDLWFEGKLGRVESMFSGQPDLVFYHNQSRPIDARGMSLQVSLDAPGRRAHRPHEASVFAAARASYADIRRAVLWGMDTNHSSMAIRRTVLLENLDILQRIQKSADSFMFYAALASGGAVAEDPRPLTGYRVHGENSMLHQQRTADEPSRFFEKVYELNSTYHADHQLLQGLHGGALPANVRKALECQLAEDQIHLDFFSRETRRAALARHVVDYVRSTSTSDLPYSVILSIYGLVNVVSHRATESIYGSWALSRHLS